MPFCIRFAPRKNCAPLAVATFSRCVFVTVFAAPNVTVRDDVSVPAFAMYVMEPVAPGSTSSAPRTPLTPRRPVAKPVAPLIALFCDFAATTISGRIPAPVIVVPVTLFKTSVFATVWLAISPSNVIAAPFIVSTVVPER